MITWLIMPLKGVIYRPTGNSSNRPIVSSPGILSTGLKYRPLGLSQTKIIGLVSHLLKDMHGTLDYDLLVV